jgi:hypothetical protein
MAITAAKIALSITGRRRSGDNSSLAGEANAIGFVQQGKVRNENPPGVEAGGLAERQGEIGNCSSSVARLLGWDAAVLAMNWMARRRDVLAQS